MSEPAADPPRRPAPAPDVRVGSTPNALEPISVAERSLAAGPRQGVALVLVAVAAIAADQATKQLVGRQLQLGEETAALGPFSIHHVQNSGIAFGFFPTATTIDRDVADLPAAVNEVRLDGLALLIVDDQRDSREMLAALLEQQGAIVTQRDSAERALTFLAERSVHLLIADIAMPSVDGYEFLQRLRAAGNRTPAIAVTAFARPEDRRHAIQAGYSGYLAKPIDAGQLARTVREVVAAPTAA